MKRLTYEFKKAVVNKGEKFEIRLSVNGCIGNAKPQVVEVVSGAATLVSDIVDHTQPPGVLMWDPVRTLTYTAEQTGEIEIVAHPPMHGAASHTFKIRVK